MVLCCLCLLLSLIFYRLYMWGSGEEPDRSVCKINLKKSSFIVIKGFGFSG
jgi:hypothetical protein